MIAQHRTPVIEIPGKKIRSLMTDTAKSAESVNLVYVSDRQQGINRIRKGNGFRYVMGRKPLTDAGTLSRIKSLVLPPAWNNVWICALPNGHLQATGIDTRGRKQYKYHPLWNALRSESKFFHLYDFGKALPLIRKQVRADMSLPGLPLNKVLAVIVSLMEYTGIRIGSSSYEKLYGSFGLTTLKDRHIDIAGSEMRFSFRGKKGVNQDITVNNGKLARIVRQCKDIPGKELFQYYDDDHVRRPVDSGMVNRYIQDICGTSFTSKDFRTWVGTCSAIEVFAAIGCCGDESEIKKNVVHALDMVAERLGNTRMVCKKYYVHPIVVEHYSNRTLEKYLVKSAVEDSMLRSEEHALMNILREMDKAMINI